MAGSPFSNAGQKGVLKIEDILQMEDIGRMIIAGNGRYLVYEHQAPHATAPNIETLYGITDRSAISKLYILDLRERTQPRSLFQQASEGGYWLGSVSPARTKVAIYSLLGGRVHAGVYDFSRESVRWFQITPNYFRKVQQPVWISDDELVYPALVNGEQPSIVYGPSIVSWLNDRWEKTFRGKEPSVSVLVSSETGLDQAESWRDGVLVKIDTRTGHEVTLGAGYFYGVRMSPDGGFVSAIQEGGDIQAPPQSPIPYEGAYTERTKLMIFDLRGDGESRSPCDDCNVSPGSVQWSADGTRVAFSSRNIGSNERELTLWTYEPRSGNLVRWKTPFPWIVRKCRMTDAPLAVPLGAAVLVFGPSNIETASSAKNLSSRRCAQDVRFDWFLLRPSRESINITRVFKSVAEPLLGIHGDSIYVVAEGRPWRIRMRNLSEPTVEQIYAVTSSVAPWIQTDNYNERDAAGEALVRGNAVVIGQEAVFAIDLSRGDATAISKPAGSVELRTIDPLSTMAVFRRNVKSSAEFLVAQHAGEVRPVLAINMHARALRLGRSVRIPFEFKSLNLLSCMLLPPTWTRGERLPTIVNVYPDVSRNMRICGEPRVGPFDTYSSQLLAAHGYSVLHFEVPVDAIRTDRAPTGDLPALLLAAVDAAIEGGYADPDRLGLMGFSQGFHSALQVLTETNRFKAAVVMSGISDFSSHYGTMPLRAIALRDYFRVGNPDRYEWEDGANFMDGAPWEDAAHYVASSPYFSSAKITTPVLIIHSDFDAFPLGQSQQIFASLYRQRKVAEYVVYWGEGHIIQSPANVRDKWHRIYGWYDSYLGLK